MHIGIPLAVRPREAAQMLGVGLTKLYELLDAGDLESFHIGRARRITTASLRRYIERQITATNGASSPSPKVA
jgi:excisionase family DNA binding protein